MRVVVAIDSFKGSLSSAQAGNAVKEAVLRLKPDAAVLVKPLADGGEGTVDAFCASGDYDPVEITVSGPLLQPVPAKYAVSKDRTTAVMEIAAAAGITMISPQERNPLKTTTYGVGEMIRDAAEKGCRRFVIGIGGSATNDGGVGMLMALGYEFFDEQGRSIALGAQGIEKLSRISAEHVLPALSECCFSIACDVTNPLCGASGASAVYGPQKGATEQMVRDMDGWLLRYAALAKEISPNADQNYPGAGAAGGLGFAFLSFTNAVLRSGVDIVLEETNIEADIMGADIVVTGEGRLDHQTVMGKAPIGVAKLAKKYGKKVIAFAGSVTEDAEICNEHGIDAYFPVVRGVTTLEEAMNSENAYKNLAATSYQAFRLLI